MLVVIMIHLKLLHMKIICQNIYHIYKLVYLHKKFYIYNTYIIQMCTCLIALARLCHKKYNNVDNSVVIVSDSIMVDIPLIDIPSIDNAKIVVPSIDINSIDTPLCEICNCIDCKCELIRTEIRNLDAITSEELTAALTYIEPVEKLIEESIETTIKEPIEESIETTIKESIKEPIVESIEESIEE